MKRILITGGIGSGKSVVAEMVGVMGFPVYDCDSRAKWLMDNSKALKQQLAQQFGSDVIDNGRINRSRLAAIVFADNERLGKLNTLVHGLVRHDLEQWFAEMERVHRAAFVESAIPVTANLHKDVDSVWVVTAPIETRLLRVKTKRGMEESDFMKRVESQVKEIPDRPVPTFINNDGLEPLIPQIERLTAELLLR